MSKGNGVIVERKESYNLCLLLHGASPVVSAPPTTLEAAILFDSCIQTSVREQVRFGRGTSGGQATASPGPTGGGSQRDLRHEARAQHEARHLQIQTDTGI